jgi:hypothetical protein
MERSSLPNKLALSLSLSLFRVHSRIIYVGTTMRKRTTWIQPNGGWKKRLFCLFRLFRLLARHLKLRKLEEKEEKKG